MTTTTKIMTFNVTIEITIYYCVKTYFKTRISVDSIAYCVMSIPFKVARQYTTSFTTKSGFIPLSKIST